MYKFGIRCKDCGAKMFMYYEESFVEEFGKELFESILANACCCKKCGSENTKHVGTIWLDDDMISYYANCEDLED